jgi:hypothetical protein
MAKGILKALSAAFLMFLALSSCELLDCKTCEAVNMTNGVETRSPGVLTCGDELDEKEDYYESYGSNSYSYYDCY